VNEIRIKITSAQLASYWYATKIGEEYWAVLDNQYDDGVAYKVNVLIDGVHGWVAIKDCCILQGPQA
jgi:nitrogen fixation-related uncharacterized protein